MRCYLKIPFFLLVFLILFLVSSVQARNYIVIQSNQYFPTGQSYINFDSSILPLSFTTFYKDSSMRFHLNSTWIRSPLDLTLTSFYTSNWFNYSVSGSGTQEIYTGVKPDSIYFDNVEQTEGVTWSYSLGIVSVTTSSTNVGLSFEESTIYDRSASLNLNLYPLEVLDYDPVYYSFSPSYTNNLYYGENFGLYFTSGQTLGFHANIQRNKQVTLEVTNGTLNANETFVSVTSSRGTFRFNSTENCTFSLTSDISNIKVNGITVRSPYSHVANENSDTIIEWFVTLSPALPIKFILGMFGLCGMFGGSLYAIKKMKEKEYYDAIRNGAIFMSIGVAFFLAWLF